MNQAVLLDRRQDQQLNEFVRLLGDKTVAIKRNTYEREMLCVEIIKARDRLEKESKRLTWFRAIFRYKVNEILINVNKGLTQFEGLLMRRQGFTDAITQLKGEHEVLMDRCVRTYPDETALNYIADEILVYVKRLAIA